MGDAGSPQSPTESWQRTPRPSARESPLSTARQKHTRPDQIWSPPPYKKLTGARQSAIFACCQPLEGRGTQDFAAVAHLFCCWLPQGPPKRAAGTNLEDAPGDCTEGHPVVGLEDEGVARAGARRGPFGRDVPHRCKGAAEERGRWRGKHHGNLDVGQGGRGSGLVPTVGCGCLSSASAHVASTHLSGPSATATPLGWLQAGSTEQLTIISVRFRAYLKFSRTTF